MKSKTPTQIGLSCEAQRREIERLITAGKSPTGYTVKNLKRSHGKDWAELANLGTIPSWVRPLK